MTFVKVNSPLSRSFDNMIKDFFNEFPSTVTKTLREDVLYHPPVTIIENDNDYVLQFSVPGYDKSDFSISLDGQILTISADQKEEQITGKIIRREFGNKAFKRSFTLDEKIDSGKIDALYSNGILTLSMPKKVEAKEISRAISVR